MDAGFPADVYVGRAAHGAWPRGYDAVMTTPQETAPSGEFCPVCGKELVVGTTDFADTPGETQDVDVPRRELNPGQMVQTSFCPDPDCPGSDAGAQL